ncbi:MAG TPA: SDR family NAD(P)-dependent oxidoreductase [Actinomycetota bacterium]|jgi:NAD(P)-dependent dehydrogenase (short-subunit alcohol dehydrogenase family)
MESLVWISGASGAIGQALVRTVPWPATRVIGISRSPTPGAIHLEADLSDPSGWDAVGASFGKELAGFPGGRVVLVHAAGTVDPIGFAGEVDTESYRVNVVLNSAAPQVLGHLFLDAASSVRGPRHLVMLTSGAARSVYPGWSSYGAGKAAVDQWVRDVGAEQVLRSGDGGVQVVSVGPGTVDTGMQAQLRAATEHDFPNRQKFVDLWSTGKLADPEDVARGIWDLLDRGLPNGSVIDLRDLADPG